MLLKIREVILIFVICICITDVPFTAGNKTFVIDYENNQFLMDGQPFRYIAGCMHYFRVPKVHWENRFDMIKAAGLNAVQTYIEWSQHEPEIDVYNFDDNLDFLSYFRLAQQKGLYVILRAGPYICAERDMACCSWPEHYIVNDYSRTLMRRVSMFGLKGGLPYWLLRENPKMELRTFDPTYIYYVTKWLNKLLPMIEPLLYVNGGPILTVQVENEYGSYYACDWNYMNYLRDLFRSKLGPNVVLFTTDGNADFYLKCGKIQNLYATVDFGPGENVNDSFHAQRNHEPNGPPINSEYYTGGHTTWGYGNYDANLTSFIITLKEILDANASLSMYMFHGGTSFGFTNGANIFQPGYVADLTSYDFGAPVNESGHATEQYYLIRDTLKEYVTEDIPPVPEQPQTVAYGQVQLEIVGTLFDLAPLLTSRPPVTSTDVMTFEQLSQAYGFIIYESRLTKTFMDPDTLFIPDIRDRGYVFLDYDFVGIVSRIGGIVSLPITGLENQTLSILVENQGRLNYGPQLNDFKGLLSNPKIGTVPLYDWKMTLVPFNATVVDKVVNLMVNHDKKHKSKPNQRSASENTPSVYVGDFVLTENETQDTFLNMEQWQKGIAILNGFNLGRYWPHMGPQVTLYVPKSTLRPFPQHNRLIILELQKAPCSPSKSNVNKSKMDINCTVEFISYAILNGTTPKSYDALKAT